MDRRQSANCSELEIRLIGVAVVIRSAGEQKAVFAGKGGNARLLIGLIQGMAVDLHPMQISGVLRDRAVSVWMRLDEQRASVCAVCKKLPLAEGVQNRGM